MVFYICAERGYSQRETWILIVYLKCKKQQQQEQNVFLHAKYQ